MPGGRLGRRSVWLRGGGGIACRLAAGGGGGVITQLYGGGMTESRGGAWAVM